MRTIAAVLACLALAACGSDDEEPAAPTPFADVVVTVDPDGEGGEAARSVDVRCDAPEDSAACAALAEGALEPTPRGTACTQQFGGPQTATVTGTVEGRPVDAELSRANGCEIARWQEAAPLLDLAR
jgi:hypothetical protein